MSLLDFLDGLFDSAPKKRARRKPRRARARKSGKKTVSFMTRHGRVSFVGKTKNRLDGAGGKKSKKGSWGGRPSRSQAAQNREFMRWYRKNFTKSGAIRKSRHDHYDGA